MNVDPPSPASPAVLPTHTPALFDAAVRNAAQLLRAGHVVAIPTETVYGLAANALDPAAVDRIYRIKGRPAHNPVIVHVANIAMARQCARHWPEDASRLAAAFWPGPLTLVLPRDTSIPDVVTAGGDTVGIRWPSHPFAQALIRACGFPLAAPSANRANAISPTNASHVATSLGSSVPLIIDGGACQVGLESTVVDLSGPLARILRPGVIHEESLAAVVRLANAADPVAPGPGQPLLSPGQLPRHYAPRARLLILHWRNDAELGRQLREAGALPESTHILAHSNIPSPDLAHRICVIPHDPEAYARALYAEWHCCDELGAATIVVESVPDLPEWRAIRDRFQRAAAPAD